MARMSFVKTDKNPVVSSFFETAGFFIDKIQAYDKIR